MLGFVVVMTTVVAQSQIIPQSLSGEPVVIDGQTLEFNQFRVSLLGISSPAPLQYCTAMAGAHYACGRESVHALHKLVEGQIVECEVQQEPLSAPPLARCTVNGLDLSESMVRAGHAVLPRQDGSSTYAPAQSDARSNRRGLWKGSFLHPEEWRTLFKLNPPVGTVSSDQN
jgi:endonuclease YncB( thermonuclease family)